MGNRRGRLAGHRARRRVTSPLTGILLAVGALASPAHADEVGRVLVIPLESQLGPDRADIGLGFNLALAQVSAGEGAEVTVAQASLEDTMAVVGCTERSPECLAQVATALEVDHIVYGRIAPGQAPDTYEISLVVTSADPDAPQLEHRFLVHAADASNAEPAFVEATPSGFLERPSPFRSSAPEPRPSASDSAPPPTRGNPSVGDTEAGSRYRFELDRVHQSSWIVTGAGGAMFGLGVVFWALASSAQSDVDAQPVDSIADLERLADLEDTARSRATTGNILALVGLATTAIGMTLAIRQGLVETPAEDDAAMTVAPLSGGGAMVLMRWSL
ncbi:hypothetical protein [Haliangium sp.]|uniref:hypothetical protein n=1 Tax=Haliangium sp. TaxID=2663208 RepID=UPI003D0C088C